MAKFIIPKLIICYKTSVCVHACVCVCVCVPVCACVLNLQVIVNDYHWGFVDGQCWSVNEGVTECIVFSASVLCALYGEGGGREREGEGLGGVFSRNV